MCMSTNVAKTQDVPLDGTIFLGNTGQKDRATLAFTSGRRAQNASSEWNGQKRNIIVNL